MVQKFTGASGSATKKVDALIDKISEYGRKKGAKQNVVDAGIQYLRDKSDEFVETQRYSQDPKYKNKEPIHMLSDERLKRLDRLQKNYGTPPKQTGKVNLLGTGERKTVPQVDVGDTVPTFETKTVTQQSAPRITTSANAPSSVKTPLKMKSISPASFRLAEKLKAKLETNQTTVTKPSEGVTKTGHVLKIKTSKVVETGTEKLEEVESIRKGKPPKYPEGVELEKKGQIKSALRESGTTTSFDPVGVESAIDSAREFDEHSIMSKDADAPLYPQQSSQREDMIRQQRYNLKTQKYEGQGIPKGQKVVKFPALTTAGTFDPKARKFTQFGTTATKKPEHLTPKQTTEYKKAGLQVPTKTAVVIHPFSKMKSGMVQWDRYKRPDLEVAPGEKITKRDWEVDMEIDKGGGEHFEAHTDDFMDKQQTALNEELAKPDKKGRLPATAIARQPWKGKNIRIGDTKASTPTTSVADSLAGDSMSTEYDPKTGERFKQTSATSPHNVGEAIPPYKEGDPEFSGKPKKPKDPMREHLRRLESLRTESSNIEIKTNKAGKEYFLLKKNPGFEGLTIEQEASKETFKRKVGNTRADQIKKNYIQFRGKAEVEFRAKPITETVEHANVDQWGRPITGEKEHGPMKRTFTLKKTKAPVVKTKGATAGSVITKAFGIGKTGLKVLGPIALLGLTPLVAEASLRQKKIINPTVKQRLQENVATFFGSGRVFSGVNEQPGYIQNLAKYDINALRKSGLRRKKGPIAGAGGPKTPYANIKAWMFSKPKTTLPYKSDMETKSDW